MSSKDPEHVAKLLHRAKNAAGGRASVAAGAGRWEVAREWSALAVSIDTLLRDSVTLLSKGAPRR